LYKKVRLMFEHPCIITGSTALLGPGLPQKLLPAEVSSYCFVRFHDKSLFQGAVVSTTPNP
jgi:hypothetical protein